VIGYYGLAPTALVPASLPRSIPRSATLRPAGPTGDRSGMAREGHRHRRAQAGPATLCPGRIADRGKGAHRQCGRWRSGGILAAARSPALKGDPKVLARSILDIGASLEASAADYSPDDLVAGPALAPPAPFSRM